MEKMPFSNGDLKDAHAAIKDEDIDSPGTATSKFVEPLSLAKMVPLSDKVEHGDSSGNCNAIQIKSQNEYVKCLVPGSVGEKTVALVSSEVSLSTDAQYMLCDSIVASNRECANRACEVFDKLLPREQHMTDFSRTINFSSCQSASLVKEKFAKRKQFLRFKERVITLKFKVFQHLWKEDMRLLSVRKHRPKSQKKFDLSLRTALTGNQKPRSSIRSRFSSPGNLSLVPTAEMINFTSKLLSDSQVKLCRNTLKMPALILDKKEKLLSGFISSNGLVEDPCAVEKERAMISCITSSVDPGESYREWKCQKVDSGIKWPLTPDVMHNFDDETCSDESCGEMDPSDWTDEEKSMFIQAVSSYGKDFVMISRCVRTRSRDQCKVFFSKARKCLGLDLIHPGPRNVGTPVTDDANGGGSDAEDACVVEAVETGSVICGNKLGCKLDEDLPLITMDTNDDESGPAKIVNFESDRNRSEENNGMGHMDYEDFEAVETSVSDACQAENIPELLVHGDSNIMNSFENHSDSVHARRSTVVVAATETGGDQVIEQSTSIAEMASVREGIKPFSLSPEALMENKGLASVGFENELRGQELLLPKCSLIRTQEKCGPSGLQSSVQDSNTIGNCSGLHPNPEYQHKVSLELDSMEKPYVISLPLQNSPPTATSPSQDTASILCDTTLNQDRLSSTLDFRGNGAKQSPKSVSRDDFHQNLSSHPILSHDDSSQILRGYPLQISNKKEMNGDVSSRELSEVQTLSQSEITTRSVAQDCHLQKCNSSKLHSSVAELPLLSQKIEKTILHSRAHSRSLSDTDKPCRNGDVKLFGQILSHPSSTQKSNSNTHENEEKGIHNSKLSSKLSNLKFSGYHDVDGNSALLKFDRNNYLGLENVAMRSYGFWDGNRIQTGFPSLPDSTILLAKYPAAFGNYPTPSSKIEPLPLQTVVKSNERNLNGVPGFPREMSSSNGVVDCQLYRNREGSKVQPFTVDMKQRQDIFSEIQRQNGFEAVSSLQPQGRGMVGMNVVGRKVIVGGPCTGVSDPVAAIKMHYAKSDQYGGQTGSVIGEEESWRGKGDIGR
ncbi:hypothetical protein I3842_01G276300 [Carya illinoinensis]|uniref:SANT domain-containing protein n=1 Tax=Carya illinoinensis TaxID=32201 RepID=A0A922G9I2_CARIL|nr:hypothetical protein I3842_01G276300 [Carya illinoinensis]